MSKEHLQNIQKYYIGRNTKVKMVQLKDIAQEIQAGDAVLLDVDRKRNMKTVFN